MAGQPEEISLVAGELRATFCPDLGMLGVSLTRRGEEFLALPGGLEAYRAGRVTGLPLLAPWANRLASRRFRVAGVDVQVEGPAVHHDDNGLPLHGTMTAQPGWQVTRRGPAAVDAQFDYGARPELIAAFPFPHELLLAISIVDDSLHVATTLTPTSDRPVPVSFGWHPFFCLDGPRESWQLRLPERRRLLLDERGLPTGRSEHQPAAVEFLGTQGYDELYRLEDGWRLQLESRRRRVVVELSEGYGYAQVFAPAGRRFACLEPMTAPTNALVSGTCPLVQPGARFTARFAVTPELRQP